MMAAEDITQAQCKPYTQAKPLSSQMLMLTKEPLPLQQRGEE